jgi:hypothetical protein
MSLQEDLVHIIGSSINGAFNAYIYIISIIQYLIMDHGSQESRVNPLSYIPIQ